jgi:hypothetical protein
MLIRVVSAYYRLEESRSETAAAVASTATAEAAIATHVTRIR